VAIRYNFVVGLAFTPPHLPYNLPRPTFTFSLGSSTLPQIVHCIPTFKVLINGLQSLGGIYLAVAISKEYKQCLDGYMGFFNMVLMIH